MTRQTLPQNEVVIRSGRTAPMGEHRWEIRDNGEPIKYTDFITEARQVNGVVYLTFGACFIDADNEGVVDVASRLRMDITSAQTLHSMLGQLITNVLTPPDLSKAN